MLVLPLHLQLLVMVVTAALGSAAGQALPPPSYNCAQGCPGDAEPVCGQDAITYLNRCVAVCQEVLVSRPGACGQAGGASFQDASLSKAAAAASSSTTSSFVSGPAISAEDMQRYKQQGFSLAGRAAVGAFEPDYQQKRRKADSRATLAAPATPSAATVAVRHAGDGLVYVRQPASKSTGFAGVQRGQRPPFESAFSPDSAAGSSDAMQRSDGAWTPGFSPKQQQQAGFVGAQQGPAATAAANAAATELLLQHMLANGRKRRRLLSRRWQVAVQRVQQHLHASQRPAPQPGHQQQLLPPLAMHSRQQPQQQPQQQPHQVLPVPDSMSHLHRPDALQRRQQQRTLSYVIGADNRREFAGSSRAWPLSAVGHLLYAKGSCTGVMIGPDTVLTAAHCVYSRQRSAWQGGMTFVPHRHRGDGGATLEPFGRVPVESVTTYSGWTNNANTTDALQYDLAVVKLANTGVGYKTGWLGLAWSPAPFKGTVHTAGYPGDKPRGSLWRSSCRVRDSGAHLLNVCDTWSGQSGAPLWEKRGDSTFLLRAVMSYEACSCCSDDCKCCSNQINGACKITEQHYQNILKWR